MSNRRGRYHEWLTTEGLTTLEGWARNGLTNDQIAKNIGIHRDTLYTWIRKYPDIADALKKGKEVVDIEVENALLKRALGYEYEEVKTLIEEVDGRKKKKVEKTIKHIPADTTAGIFWLRNRKGLTWSNRDVVDTERIKAETAKVKAETEKISGDNDTDSADDWIAALEEVARKRRVMNDEQ